MSVIRQMAVDTRERFWISEERHRCARKACKRGNQGNPRPAAVPATRTRRMLQHAEVGRGGHVLRLVNEVEYEGSQSALVPSRSACLTGAKLMRRRG